MNTAEEKITESSQKNINNNLSKHIFFSWRTFVVGLSIGAVIGASVGLVIIISMTGKISSLQNDFDRQSIELTTLNKKYSDLEKIADKSMLSDTRYAKYQELMNDAAAQNNAARQQDLLTYYHPWDNDPDWYKNRWLDDYIALRRTLWSYAEYYKNSNYELYIRQLVRLGVWSDSVDRGADAWDTFETVISNSKVSAYAEQKLLDSGALDLAYLYLGYAKRYSIPTYIDDKLDSEIYDILIQWDGLWVKPEKLKELQLIEEKAKSNKN